MKKVIKIFIFIFVSANLFENIAFAKYPGNYSDYEGLTREQKGELKDIYFQRGQEGVDERRRFYEENQR